MSVVVEDREVVRPLLMRDRIRNAVVVNRVYHNPEFTLTFADQLPEPKGVLALRPASGGNSPHQFALHALDPIGALRVLRAVPPGFCLYHVADELAFPALRERVQVGWWGEAILYKLDAADFRDVQAAKVAKIWEPDWPAEGYVRSRIEEGLNGAIYEDGEPVAWYLTHLETEDVVMLGFLHVLDAYRRKGYAKSLSCALIKQTFAKGKIPCCHVYTNNEPSIRLMEGLGFQRVCLQAWGDGVARA